LTISDNIVANSTNGDCAGGGYIATNNRATGPCGTTPVKFLGPLADNGGPTLTHALLQGSNAIDAAIGDCPPTDQRGVARPQGDACDIGAYESPSLPTNHAADAGVVCGG
jgi:hypothetical protein